MQRAEDTVLGKDSTRVFVPLATILILVVCALCSKTTALTVQQSGKPGESAHDHLFREQSREPEGAAVNVIPDVEVVDQDGKPLHFYTDLIKGKSVVVNFMFTSCRLVCPLQGANFSKLQVALGDRLDKEVTLVSVTIDPVRDTPQRLKSWGEKFGAKPGWTLVTGNRASMDRLLVALTGNASGLSEHPGIAFVGNYDRGVWIRMDALDDPARLIKALDAGLRQK